MRVLCLGDIVGRAGRKAVKEQLPRVIDTHQVDLVIANGENAAGGFGLTEEVVQELFDLGCHVITGGNHSWDKSEVFGLLDREPRLLRPDNYPPGNPGHGTCVVETAGGIPVGVFNLEGRLFMGNACSDPFRAADKLIEKLSTQAKVLVLDFHAETTSEKRAMGWYLDGRISMMVGTHTHIQTADEQIMPGGTAYLTDIGMCGPDNSVIGIKTEVALERFLTGRGPRLETAKKGATFRGVLAEIDETTGKAQSIERFQLSLQE